MAAGNGRTYSLSFLTAAQDAAGRSGRRRELAAALRSLQSSLKHDPASWGDPQSDYRHLSLRRLQHTDAVLIVLYSVHAASRTVIVQHILPTPGTPLADAFGG